MKLKFIFIVHPDCFGQQHFRATAAEGFDYVEDFQNGVLVVVVILVILVVIVVLS